MYVRIEMESAFENDSVKISVDDKTLLESRITTNYTVNLAWSSGLQRLTRSSHTVHFAVVEYAVQKDYTIDLTNDTSTVLMRFDKALNKLVFNKLKGDCCAIKCNAVLSVALGSFAKNPALGAIPRAA
jgi:hypothetical protein